MKPLRLRNHMGTSIGRRKTGVEIKIKENQADLCGIK
jgi:hypothetical protein